MKPHCALASLLLPLCALAETNLTLKTASDFLRCGEKASFTVTVADEKGAALKAGTVSVKLDNFGPKTVLAKRVDLAKGNPFTVEGTLAEPGFLRLTATLKGAKTLIGSVGYDIGKIRPGFARPADFESFWLAAKENLEKTVPLDPRVEEIPQKKGVPCRTYRVSFASGHGKRVYGFLSVPTDRSRAPFPVTVTVPGAGPGVIAPNVSAKAITLVMNVHPYAPAADRSGMKALYDAQDKALCAKYPVDDHRYCVTGLAASREEYFFYDAILGINRAVNWLAARPDVDPARFHYWGSSQGGAFGHFLCGLNGHFTRAVFHVPACCDLGGYLLGRQSGWPALVEHQKAENRAVAAERAPYFDAANFAPMIRIPVLYTIGLADTTCAPPSCMSAYNCLGTKVKDVRLYQCLGHTLTPEMRKLEATFLDDLQAVETNLVRLLLEPSVPTTVPTSVLSADEMRRVALGHAEALRADGTWGDIDCRGSCKTSVSVWEGRALSRPRTGRSPSLPRFCNCRYSDRKGTTWPLCTHHLGRTLAIAAA